MSARRLTFAHTKGRRGDSGIKSLCAELGCVCGKCSQNEDGRGHGRGGLRPYGEHLTKSEHGTAIGCPMLESVVSFTPP